MMSFIQMCAPCGPHDGSARMRSSVPMVLAAPVDDLEESDVLIPPRPLADRTLREPDPNLASVRSRNTEPNEPVTNHEREPVPPRPIEKLPTSTCRRRRISCSHAAPAIIKRPPALPIQYAGRPRANAARERGRLANRGGVNSTRRAADRPLPVTISPLRGAADRRSSHAGGAVRGGRQQQGCRQ